MKARFLLIRWALRLQRPPFLWIFQLYYRVAIQCSRILVSRVEGVQSIYLTGSSARGDVMYGLSDIDFKILVAGNKRMDVLCSIHRRFSALRRFFPMLGPPDEKGVYFIDSFSADYEHHPLIQHLFDLRYFQHQLLWGKDLLSGLPVKSWKELDQAECAFGRLKDWIERIHLLAGFAGFAAQQKQHLYFKAISDVALLALRSGTPEYNFSRRSEILKRIIPTMEKPYRRLIENSITENDTLYRRKLNKDDENFALFKRMVSFCAEQIYKQDTSDSISLPAGFQRVPFEDCDEKVLGSLRAISANVRGVTATRWPQLPLNPFDLHLFNAPAYIVDCSQPVGHEEFHALKAYYRKNLKTRGVLLLREHTNFLSSVDSDLVDHWASFPGSSDLLFCLVSDTQKTFTRTQHRRIVTRLKTFVEQLSATLADPQFGRMDPAVFPSFVFNALRVLIFSHEFQRGRWRWAVTPGAITDFLIAHTPLQPSFPRILCEQFEKDSGEEAFDERLLPKTRALLTEMLEIVQGSGSLEALSKLNAMADEQYLTISVAIVTANRPAQLQRCLDSIARLVRPPAELIVVNDGHDPKAQRIVTEAHLPFPVHYLECDRHGVAHARNLAARTSRGEIIAFVDDDACVAPDWLERLERIFLRDSRVGLATGSILNMDCERKDKIWQFMETVEKI